jgi:hypothetical protein
MYQFQYINDSKSCEFFSIMCHSYKNILQYFYEQNITKLLFFQECDLYYVVSVYHAALGMCAHVALTIVVTSILYWKIYREALSHKRKTPNAFDKSWETSITITMVTINITSVNLYLVKVKSSICIKLYV